jgi:4-hydroxybenzoate polyprenyltransferase
MSDRRRLLRWPVDLFFSGLEALESDRVSLAGAGLSFAFAVCIRNYLEIFSDKADFTPIALIHFTLFYFSLAMLFALVLHFFSGESLVKVLKVVLPSFAVIVIVPPIDLVTSWGEGINISYFEPGRHTEMLKNFLFFGGPRVGPGVSIGQRIESALAVVGIICYLRAKGRSWWIGIVAAFICYTIGFAHSAAPFLVAGFLGVLGERYMYSDELMAQALALVVFVDLCLVAYRANRVYFLAFVRDFRWMRFAHYFLMFVGGLVWTNNVGHPFDLHRTTVFIIFLVPVSLIFASLFSIVTNNMADIEIDRISNPKRPLFTKEIDPKKYLSTAPYFLALSLLFAVLAGFDYLFVMIVIIGNYYLYSMPPLRLKRVPVLSKGVIAVNSVGVIILGYLARGHSPRDLDMGLVLIVLAGFTLVSNFIDLKDVDGDRHEGIKTLPVLLGLRAAKIIIGFAFVVVYLSVYLVINDTLLLVGLIGLGAVQMALVNRKHYSEFPVFAVHLVSIASLIGYIIIFKPFLIS